MKSAITFWGEYAGMVQAALDVDAMMNVDIDGERLRPPMTVPVDPRDLKYLLSYVHPKGVPPSAADNEGDTS